MKHGQSKRDSLLESTANILVGYGVAIAAQKAIFPFFGMHISTMDNCKVAALFTIVSLIRSYLLRRAFNAWHIGKAKRAWDQLVAAQVAAAYLNAGVMTVDETRENFGHPPLSGGSI